jgi:hypothetical protein
MEKEFIPYEQALELKELGFKEECSAHFLDVDDLELKWKIYRNLSFNTNNCLQAPLYQQAFRWFREKHNLFGCIDLHTSTPIHWYIRIDDIIKNDYIYHSEDNDLKFKTYEEAELACLKKLIEIVETKQI